MTSRISDGFSKIDTLKVKGLAVVLMVMCHVFAFKTRFNPLLLDLPLSIYGYSLESLIGYWGKCCVSLFLCLSGYGLYMSSISLKMRGVIKYIGRHLCYFYINYLIVVLTFGLIGVYLFYDNRLNADFAFRYSLTVGNILGNIMGFHTTINREWWFVSLYIQLLLIFPLFKVIVDKRLIYGLTLWIVVILSGIILFFLCEWHFMHLATFLLWSPCFINGLLIARFNGFRLVKKKIQSNSFYFYAFLFFFLSLIFMLSTKSIYFYHLVMDFLVGIYILIITRIMYSVNLSLIFAFIGKHSLNIWLIHTFFCYYYFQKILIHLRWAWMVFFVTLILSVLCSFVLLPVQKKISAILLPKGYFGGLKKNGD